MTCESALEQLLDAEPSELDGDERTPLSSHLRGCARCRRVAVKLAQDTRLLANAMHTAQVRQPAPRALPALVPALALGAVVMAVLLRSGGERAPSTQTVVEQAVPEASAPVMARAPSADVAPARVTRARPAPLRAFAPAVALTPVRFEPAAVPPASSTPVTNVVAVTPPPGTRATVMHTSNPKFVVVWLY